MDIPLKTISLVIYLFNSDRFVKTVPLRNCFGWLAVVAVTAVIDCYRSPDVDHVSMEQNR